MITNEQVINYLKAIEPNRDSFLEELETSAIKDNIPIIKKDVQGLLRVLLSIIKPYKILEIGTAVGFSSILMSNYLQQDGKITTIEKNQEMIKMAKQNINKAGKESNINILEGDANKILVDINDEYDFIFMDAAKGQYINYLPHCIKVLKKNGVLLSDNVLQDGYITKSRYSIPRRQRTIHNRMREYLWEINNNTLLETVVLPIADGVTISYKR